MLVSVDEAHCSWHQTPPLKHRIVVGLFVETQRAQLYATTPSMFESVNIFHIHAQPSGLCVLFWVCYLCCSHTRGLFIAYPFCYLHGCTVLIGRLRICGLGRRLDRQFFGCVIYADDVLLLSHSVGAMRHMLDTCEIFETIFIIINFTVISTILYYLYVVFVFCCCFNSEGLYFCPYGQQG